METIILMTIAVILFFGMVGDDEQFNKRTYCYGFIACMVVVAVTEVVKIFQ